MKHEKKNASIALRFRRLTRKNYGAFNTMHRVINIGTLSSLALACAYTSTVSAQNVAASSPERNLGEPDKELTGVTVTASKTATPLNEATRLVTVISAREIAQTPARSIQELLNYVAGIDVAQRGAQGVQADVSIRGGSHEQIVVLLNGVNVSSSKTGHLSFDFPVNLSDIERIEILRGPSALIYGTGAFSGAINIITKHSTETSLYAKASAGMYRLTGVELRGAKTWGNTENSLSASRRSSAGYRANTDYELYNALWQTRLNLTTEDKLDLQLGYNEKRFGANSFYTTKYPNQYEHTQRMMASLRGNLGAEDWRILPVAYWDREYDRFDLVRGTTFGQNHHIVNNYGVGLTANFTSILGTTTIGSEFRYEEVVGNKLGTPRSKPESFYTKFGSRTNINQSLEHTVKLDKWLISAGTLLNYNTLLSGTYNFLPSVSVNYHPLDRWSFVATWSRSMRLPTLNDLWYTDPVHQHGDNLQPEYAHSFEGMVKYQTSHLQAHLSYFLMKGSNLLDWVKFDNAETHYTSHNIAELTNQGVEAGLALRLGDYLPLLGASSRLNLDYLYMQQSHYAPHVAQSKYALNYLRHKFTAQLSHSIGSRLDALWALRYQDRVNQNNPFATLDLKLDYHLSKQLGLGLELNNITDTQYTDIAGVPQPGFWLSGSISYYLHR